ncbi:MAG TPA: exonuclease SbcCD subunit D [Dehalococcoidia bacterium]
MRFLHTSDWHIGRAMRGQSRREEQEAALAQVLEHAVQQQVDCLLVAGDVFDTSSPTPEAERIVYSFFRDLSRAHIPAVVIAGNHDHPMRFDALSRLVVALDIHLLGAAKAPDAGGIITIRSRDGNETASIAALPWISEREAVDFATLQDGTSEPIVQYAERVGQAMKALASAMPPETCNVMLAHLFTNNAEVGAGGGERELTLNMGIYGVNPQMLPPQAQYMALGHVHKAQTVRKSPAACYSGSLLQLDFGEVKQDKLVNLVEIHPRRPTDLTPLAITAGKVLADIGSPSKGVTLPELGSYAALYPPERAWLRVYVDVDIPVANLSALVKAELPNAVHVERVQAGAEQPDPAAIRALGPVEMFETFYKSEFGRGKEPSAPTMNLYRRLLEEAGNEAD